MRKSKYPSKGKSSKRNNFKDSTKNYEVKGDSRDDRGSNDSSWYTRNAQLALDAGRLAFTWPTGAPIDFDVPFSGHIASESSNYMRFPGVMTLYFAPTYGLTNNATDPINISAKNIYSWVRHANSGHSNYDAPDLMLYILAVDNIYMMYQHMCRIYGIARLFAQKNRHLPVTLMEGLGVDYDNILSNLADYRAYLNTTAVKIGSLCVPNTMPLFSRHTWMCSGIYADSPSVKSQFYMFRPRYLGKYVETNGAGELTDVQIPTSGCTFASMKAILDGLIDAVVQSEDMNIMSGDILKAYGEENLVKVSMIGEDYMIAPQYNEEVLRQIQNATVLCGAYGLTNNQLIYQDVNDNILKTGIVFPVGSAYYGAKRILTGTSENPDPSEVLVNSRLMVHLNLEDSGTYNPHTTYTGTPSSCASEVVLWARLSYFNHATGAATHDELMGELLDVYTSSLSSATANKATYGTAHSLSLINFFNYHPLFFTTGKKGSALAYGMEERITFYFDVDNYAIVDAHDIEKLHNTAMLSMLDVPQLGRV